MQYAAVALISNSDIIDLNHKKAPTGGRGGADVQPWYETSGSLAAEASSNRKTDVV